MSLGKKLIIFVAAAALVGGVAYGFGVWPFAEKEKRAPIEISKPADEVPAKEVIEPTGPVSPITGLPCDNWNRRPIAVMQPSDRQARPASGFSEADMVFEIPTPAFDMMVTRLLGVYLCNTPEDIGSMRSTRHDFIALAGGLDAVFVGWGGSAFALKKLNENVIENIDCNGQGGKKAPECCYRKTLGQDGLNRVEDTGYAKGAKLFECAKNFGYRTEGKFEGYRHAKESAREVRPKGGTLVIGYPTSAKVEYAYDPETNSFLRTWGGSPDVDRNNRQRIAPKNIVVMVAENEQILAEENYSNRPQDPWSGLEEWEKVGPKNISGRYNNLQIGDPWFDTKGEGEARYYMDGKEFRGTWKKERGSIDSKLIFSDASGKEVTFVPGQIWVDIVVPGLKVEWTPQG